MFFIIVVLFYNVNKTFRKKRMPDGRLIFNVVMLAADTENYPCLLYTSDAADEEDSGVFGVLRFFKKKKRAMFCRDTFC